MIFKREFSLGYVSFEFSLSVVVVLLHPLDSRSSHISFHWCGHEFERRESDEGTNLSDHTCTRLDRSLCFKFCLDCFSSFKFRYSHSESKKERFVYIGLEEGRSLPLGVLDSKSADLL